MTLFLLIYVKKKYRCCTLDRVRVRVRPNPIYIKHVVVNGEKNWCKLVQNEKYDCA